MPRPQRARMGVIRSGDPARDTAVAWTTLSDEPADSSAAFLSSVIANQNYAVTSTPGTLTYTPANNTPAPNVAPWNSWLQPNCGPDGSGSSGPAPATPDAQTGVAPARTVNPLYVVLGLIGGLASAKYLFSNSRGR